MSLLRSISFAAVAAALALIVGRVLRFPVLGGVFMVGVYCAVLCGAFYVYFRHRDSQFVIDRNGIHDSRAQWGVVEWCDIHRVSVQEIHGVPILAVDVVDASKYLSRLSRWQRRGANSLMDRGYAPICFGMPCLDRSVDEVWKFISERHPHLVLK
ncbi:MAG: STM3941 family protein [Planctomycetales bacterium]